MLVPVDTISMTVMHGVTEMEVEIQDIETMVPS